MIALGSILTTTPPRKKLIEVSIPLEAINKASAREKSIRHGHPSTLHLWWARRPLAACRAVLFAQLVDDPSAWPDRFPTEEDQDRERRRLHKVIEDMVPWEASNNERILNAARWEIARSVAWGLGEEPPPADDAAAILDYLQTKAPPVYDPFSGGGSIPLEAQRLGLRAYGSDLNPVAVLIGKALVEIPPKFAGKPPVNPKAQAALQAGGTWNGKGAQGLAEDVRYYGQWMRDEAEKRIGHLYPKATLPDGSEATVIAWLWARTARSPDPAAKGAMVPLVSSFMLSTKEGKKAWVEVVIDEDAPDGWRFEVKTGALLKSDEERLRQGTKMGRGTHFTCVLTGVPIDPDHVRRDGLAQLLGVRLLAVVAEGNRSRTYLSPTSEQETIAISAKPMDTTGLEVEMPDNPRWFSPPGYGMKRYVDIFTPRQLVALTTFSDLVGEARERVLADALVAPHLGARASRPLLASEWHARRLPHWEAGEVPQSITFRLAGSLPAERLAALESELAHLAPDSQAHGAERRRRIEAMLDAGDGPRHLADPRAAEIVQNAFRHFADARYRLHAWCVMPNHVHVLITPLNGESLSAILHSWKSFTAKAINEALGLSGGFWQPEYFDRVIRNAEHFARAVAYIEENPVKAGLVGRADAWAWSSAAAGEKHADEGEWRAGRAPSQALHAGGTGAEAYADAVATYLAFATDRLVDRCSSICTWDTGAEGKSSTGSPGRSAAIRGTFARQSLPMTWDYAEANIFSESASNFLDALEWVLKPFDFGRIPAFGLGVITNINASSNSFPVRPIVISTDPPYYDNIGYADLSDYFYVWLRRSLGIVWPDLFRRLTTPKDDELVATPYRHGGKAEAEAFFMNGMEQALTAMRNAATDAEPLTIYYAFKQAEVAAEGVMSSGWAAFLQAVVGAGLLVDGTWPVRTELANRMIGKDANALASSIVLVCRKRDPGAKVIARAEFIRLLKRELPDAIDDIRKAGVGPVDMQQAVIGPGMGVFSRHARVLEDDDSAMPVKTALALINRVWGDIENETDTALDAPTQVALAWYAQHGFEVRASGDLIMLANAKNIPSDSLFSAGVFTDLKGKTRLTPREDLPPGWSPKSDTTLTVWECVQHTARVLNAADGGGPAAARLVAEMGPRGAEARALAYRLFQIATTKGMAAEALVYNELAREWPNLEDLAGSLEATVSAARQGSLPL